MPKFAPIAFCISTLVAWLVSQFWLSTPEGSLQCSDNLYTQCYSGIQIPQNFALMLVTNNKRHFVK
jgi:hypothetical protein